MDSALVIHRLHFAFTITYHYLFPQLTMGLAPLIVIFKSLALWKRDERYNRAARFWAKIFAINFLFGVITGIPMEFQFGTNWARFSNYAGGVIATALAMEGVFAFFLESSFLGLFLFGEKRFGQRVHWLAAFMVFAGIVRLTAEDVIGLFIRHNSFMPSPSLYRRHRFPAQIISHCVWLYFRFSLSFRDVEEMLAMRGVSLSYETVREWCLKFGQSYANGLRHKSPRPGDQWHLDEVFLKIN
jgi:cytochrome bd-type quinol oxidase subunit 1